MTTPPLVFLDTETSGLNPRLHDVIEAAWAMSDGPVFDIQFDHTLENADQMALQVNRYWERGLDAHLGNHRGVTEMQRWFIRDLTGATIVAENYGFDTSMLLHKLGFEPWHYRKIELSSVAMTVFNLDRPESMRNTAARLRDLGHDIPLEDHSARADVECLRASYFALREIRNAGLAAGQGPTVADQKAEQAQIAADEVERHICCQKRRICSEEHFHQRDVERIIAERIEGNDRMHRALGQAKDRQLLNLERRLEAVHRVTYASDDGTEHEHNGHASHEGEPECPGCWVATIRAALGISTTPGRES